MRQDGTGKKSAREIQYGDDDDETLGEKKLADHKFPITSVTIQFQLLLILAAMYYAMLFTNWNNPDLYKSDTHGEETRDMGTFWLKIVVQWITMALYLLSLIAPLLCPDRDFS